MTDLRPLEWRILAYLEQRGGKARREDLVTDLASPESRIGRGILNGSNARIPQLAALWTKRLLEKGLIVRAGSADNRSADLAISMKGVRALRARGETR